MRAMRNFFGGVNKDTPEVSEPFDSEPNTGLDGKVLQIYTGRTLGGSSAINGGQFSAPANEVRFGSVISSRAAYCPRQTRTLDPKMMHFFVFRMQTVLLRLSS